MTEAEWLSNDDPQQLLAWYNGTAGEGSRDLGNQISDRKLRLFACACHDLGVSKGRDGRHDYGNEGAYISDPLKFARVWAGDLPSYHGTRNEKANLLREIVGNPFRPVTLSKVRVGGNMGLPSARPTWLTPTVLDLANAAYENRLAGGILDPHRLLVLADALEEAGCDNADVLQHLRGRERCPDTDQKWHTDFCARWLDLRAPHVRGCHILDLILGKE